MIVTQADYTRWQSMYGKGNDGTKGSENISKEQENDRQEFSVGNTKEHDTRSEIAGPDREKSFLEIAFERTLNHRLGIDQGKMDELKKEIENTEKAIEVLSSQKPQTEIQQKKLQSLEAKLKKLEEALDELVQQAADRAKEKNEPEQKASQLVAKYQSVASFL